jgi:hypothetical protein
VEVIDAAQFYCPQCSAEVDAAATQCPRCGARLSLSTPAGPRRDMLDNPWVVLALLFLATGALGLPFLWRSKGFSPLAKVVVGVAVIIYTAILLWVFFLVMAWCARTVQPYL